MTRRARGVWIGVAVVGTLLGAELVLEAVKSPEACVEVENQGAEPIEGLVVTCGTDRAVAPKVAPGDKVRLLVAGKGPQTLQLGFRQRGNGLTGYQVPGFDPGQMAADNFKIVLQIRTNEVIRFQDDADPTTPLGRVVRDLWNSIWEALADGT
jgi:hypothetical protein